MTPEQLLGLNNPIASLTDLELETHLAHFFPATRPAKPTSYILTKLGDTGATLPTSKNPMAAKLSAAYLAAGLDEHGKALFRPKSTVSFKNIVTKQNK